MEKFTRHHYSHRGTAVHVLRRVIHLSGVLWVWLYYQYGAAVAAALHLNLKTLVAALLILILILETLRLSQGWVIYGQRQYEKKRISAFAWGAIGMALVLLLAPGKAFAAPIICAYAIGDPLLGELRALKWPKTIVVLIGIIVVSGIWWLAHHWLGTPFWWLFLMGPLTVAAEWFSFTWIDDNALMQLIPLAMVLIIHSVSTNVIL